MKGEAIPALRRSISTLAAAGTLALGFGGNAAATPSASAEFGQHVASCAQEHLGQREGAPAVTCTHDGTTMGFPTFGAMVRHLQEVHGA